MVILHVKKGDRSLFLYETTIKESVGTLVKRIVEIHNGQLKIDRLYYELETLAKHGITLPPNMVGLTEDQITDLKLEDKLSKTIYPQGGIVQCEDPIGRRTGKAPNEKMAAVIDRTREEAKEQVSNKLVLVNKFVTMTDIRDALDKMKGSVMIVYPMGLPPYDPIKMEFDAEEDLEGTQASKEVLDENASSIWWASKEMALDKTLETYIGRNEKTKIIVKLQKSGGSAPQREPVMKEDEQKALMAHYYKKQEEMKRLESDEADAYLNSNWSDPTQLKKQFQGLNNIKWGPKF